MGEAEVSPATEKTVSEDAIGALARTRPWEDKNPRNARQERDSCCGTAAVLVVARGGYSW